MSLKLPEPLTVSTASELLVTIITLTDSKQPIQQMLIENGKEIVECILHAIGTSMPRSQLQYFVNILFSLCMQCVSQLSQWMEVCYNVLDGGILLSLMYVGSVVTPQFSLTTHISFRKTAV